MLVVYKCEICGNIAKKLFKTKKDRLDSLECSCSGKMTRQLPEFGVSSFEVVDNGAMNKKVELRKDATERFKERGDIYIKEMEDRERIIKRDEKD